MVEDEGPAAEKRKRELKGDIDYKFIQFDDLPRAFGEGVEGVYVQPVFVLTGGVTDDDPPQPGPLQIDAAGTLKVQRYGLGAGNIRVVQGTFTMGAVGALGAVLVAAGADDVLYLLYGGVAVGGTRIGGTDQLYIGISGGNDSASLMVSHVDDAAAAVSEIYYFPTLGQANHDLPQATGGVYHEFQTMIPSSTLINNDQGSSGAPRYLIELDGMAQDEIFTFRIYFYSVNGTALTINPLNGVIS